MHRQLRRAFRQQQGLCMCLLLSYRPREADEVRRHNFRPGMQKVYYCIYTVQTPQVYLPGVVRRFDEPLLSAVMSAGGC